MERKTRIELRDPNLEEWCSTTELFPHNFIQYKLLYKTYSFTVKFFICFAMKIVLLLY